MCILEYEIAVEHIVPSYGDDDRHDDFGHHQVEAAGLFPEVGMVLHEFYQHVDSSYIQDKAACPDQYIFEEYPFELAILGGEGPFVIDDAIDDSTCDGT